MVTSFVACSPTYNERKRGKGTAPFPPFRFACVLAGRVTCPWGRVRPRSVGDADRRVHGGESLAPAGIARRPAELAPGLRVRGAPRLGRHHSHGLTCQKP